jgi:anaerobic selenocysteine-containing dehydrogenase
MTSEAAPIRGLVTIAGNPVLSTPNGSRLDAALEGLDFMVSIDIFLNETTRHADIILPPATGLEASHYNVAFFNLSVRNTAKYSPPIFEIGPEQRYDYEILQRLGALLSDEPANEILTPETLLAGALSAGPYGPDQAENPEDALTWERLLAEPHGIDLGPLREALPGRLRTDDKVVDLAPQLFVDRLAEVVAEVPAPLDANSFTLIGRRNIRDNNSWLHNSKRLTKGKNRCTAMLNTEDAARLGLEEGAPVRVRSRVGEIVLPAEPTPDIAPGVVSIPHGYGHGRPGTRLSVAAEHAGASVNDITDDQAIDPLTGNAAVNGLPVTVERASAA